MTVENGAAPDSPPAEVSVTPAEGSAPAAESKDAQAAPSTAKDESLLDRVKTALKPKTEGSSPSQASQDPHSTSAAPSEDDDKEPDSDPTEEEKARYHSKTRKQVNRLLKQRNEALDRVKALEPQAQGFEKITSFLNEAGITSDEANLLFDVARNMKRDPAKALAQLKPYYDALQRAIGEVLPDDLQQAVTKGEVSESYARQIARSRTDQALLSQRVEANDAATQQRQNAEQRQRHAASVGQAISTWESNQAKSDPDWKLKQDRIGELIELEIRRKGYPQTTQAAVEIAERARKQVNDELVRFMPRKTAVTPVNPASAARPAPAKPTSALEAAKQALAAAAV